MRLNEAAKAVKDVFTSGGVTPSAPTNTHVELSSQSAPEPTPNHGEKDGDGKLPELAAFKNDRARVLKEIAARSNAQADADASENMPGTDEDGNEVESTPAAPEPEGRDLDAGTQEQQPDAGATTVAAQETPAAPAAPEETRTLIIDGQTVQVPVSKIYDTGTRALQKEIAADMRLNQASALLAEAKRIAEQQHQPQQQPAAQVNELNDDQLAELIQFGTKEQAAQAIKALRGSSPQIKPEEIVRAAQQAVAPQMAFEAAKNFAVAEYGDILNDPDLGAIFLNRENALRKAGDQRGYTELYKAIGDDIRTKFNRPKPGQAAVPAASPSTVTRTMAEKQAAKAQAPAAPRLASARLDGEGSQPRPPTNAEIIDRQRRARGFRPYAG